MSILELALTSSGDAKKIRGMKVESEEERFSVYDFINAVCGRAVGDNYARVTYSRLIKDGSEHKDAVISNCNVCKFPGSRQRDTPTMTLRGLQQLLMILGGKVADDYRILVSDTFARVMAGDRSLIQVIEANAESTAPVQQAFKRSLAEEPAAKTLDQMCGVKRMNDIAEMDKLEDLRIKQVKRVQEHAAAYAFLCPDGKLDDQARVMFKDQLFNLCMANNGDSITNGGGNNPLTISNVAAKMGIFLDTDELQDVGRAVAKAYKAKYGTKPSKHEQKVDGAMRPVNSYTERDRDLVEAVLATYK
jgi:hypothetical protein